jgi:hypothetical protein
MVGWCCSAKDTDDKAVTVGVGTEGDLKGKKPPNKGKKAEKSKGKAVT